MSGDSIDLTAAVERGRVAVASAYAELDAAFGTQDAFRPAASTVSRDVLEAAAPLIIQQAKAKALRDIITEIEGEPLLKVLVAINGGAQAVMQFLHDSADAIEAP